MKEYLIGALIGAVISYLIEFLFNKMKDYYNHNHLIHRVKHIDTQLSSVNFQPEKDYMAIDHAVPKYKEKNIFLTNSGRYMVVPIPESQKAALAEFGFETCETTEIIDHSIISNSFLHIGIEDYDALLHSTAEEVAVDFIAELKNGKVRFNGYMFGVEHISTNRVGIDEEPKLSLSFYKTDYFTYRVFAKLYQKLRESIHVNGVSDLNALPAFLSSFGLGCFVIAFDDVDEYLIVAHRGNNVIVDCNRLHFSMNEAFSMLDLDIYGCPSFQTCLYRGLREELGLNEFYTQQIVEYGFLDLDIILDRFEMGITAYAKLHFDENFSMDKFHDLYKSAQDKELETTEIKFVRMKDLRKFIKDNEQKFSQGSLNGLKSLLARYESRLI